MDEGIKIAGNFGSRKGSSLFEEILIFLFVFDMNNKGSRKV